MERPDTSLEHISERLTLWIGSPASIVLHTLFFVGIFALRFAGLATEQILLILTTAVSLEAIYLAIFIQMTVNRATKSLADVEENIEDLGEEVEDLGEDIGELSQDIDRMGEEVEDIGEDVEELSEDIDRIQEEDEQEAQSDLKTRVAIDSIEESVRKLITEIETLKQAVRSDRNAQ